MRAQVPKRTGFVWTQHRISQHRMSHPPAKLHPPTSPARNHATSARGQRLYNITANHAHDATTHTPGEGRAWDLFGRRFRTFTTTLRTLKRAEPNAPLRAKSLAQHHKQSHAIATPTNAPNNGRPLELACLRPSFHISMHEPPGATNATHMKSG